MTKVAFKADCGSNNNATLTSLCAATRKANAAVTSPEELFRT